MAEIIQRILRESGCPELLDLLADRMPGADLKSLLLEVFRRRAQRLRPTRILAQHADDSFVRPSEIDGRDFAALDDLAISLLPDKFDLLELGPVCPLGTCAAVTTVDQNTIVSTGRGTEVVSDSTNVLALENALRRQALLRADPRSSTRVHLATSHRVLRAQSFDDPDFRQHFRLFALTSAGRDEGSFRFELETLAEQLDFYLALLAEVGSLGCDLARIEVALTDLGGTPPRTILEEALFDPLAKAHPETTFGFDPERTAGRGYYTKICFRIGLTGRSGISHPIVVDGGLVDWTQHFLGNRKERLLTSAIGSELLLTAYRSKPNLGAGS